MKELRNSGRYKVVDLSIFQSVDKIELSSKIVDHISYTTELLEEYLNRVNELKKDSIGIFEYLSAIKYADIIDNKEIAKQDSFLIGLKHILNKEDAIDTLINHFNENGRGHITDNDIYKIHSNLICGNYKEPLIGDPEGRFVGYYEDDQWFIDYFSITKEEIPIAVNKIVQLFNSDKASEELDNVFIKPFIIHGLFASLQIFNDGNTRMGRLMQHALLWNQINEKLNFNFELPPLYATRNYHPYRQEHRDLISSIVNNNDNDSWLNWFNFNLNRMEDQIYKSNENVAEFQRKIK